MAPPDMEASIYNIMITFPQHMALAIEMAHHFRPHYISSLQDDLK